MIRRCRCFGAARVKILGGGGAKAQLVTTLSEINHKGLILVPKSIRDIFGGLNSSQEGKVPLSPLPHWRSYVAESDRKYIICNKNIMPLLLKVDFKRYCVFHTNNPCCIYYLYRFRRFFQ